ncbi:MAG: TIGR02677 family protein, partial [Thermoleophilaceae bacterium]
MSFIARLGTELESVGRDAAAPLALTAGDSTSSPPVLGTHSVLKYAVFEGAERYRRIMRVLYLEHRHFGLRLTPHDVGRKLLELYDLQLDAGLLSQCLDQLHAWGALSREYDTSLARTARELRQNRYTYDITQAAVRVEGLLEALDQLAETVGALEGSRLPEIRDALGRMARLLAEEPASGAELRVQFERLTGEIERLHAGASDFMSRLNVVIARSEQIDQEEFDACKDLLIEHMQGFRSDLRRHTPEIAEALRTVELLGAPRLAALIVSSLEIPALPGIDPEDIAARRHAELLDQWDGVCSWFLDRDGRGSPWHALNDKVIDAIRAVLDIAERIIDRRTNRADRARACERLARLVHDAPSEEAATALVSAALGIAAPRHLSVPEEDPEALAAPARTSWLTAPPAP